MKEDTIELTTARQLCVYS